MKLNLHEGEPDPRLASHADPPLALVSFALQPGPGGAEAAVTAEFTKALAEHWQSTVSTYSAGGVPDRPRGLDSHAFADVHREDLPLGQRLSLDLRDQAARSRWSLGRVASRALYERSGYSIKYHVWERWVAALLARQLDQNSDTVVVSRALPLCSLSAAYRALRSRPQRWVVNLNDPCPPGLWPGLYPLDEKTQRLQAQTFERLLPRIDAFTFPSRRLFEIHAEAYPSIRDRPVRIIPHLAPPLPAQRQLTPPSLARDEKLLAKGVLRLGFAGTLRGYLPHPALVEALNATETTHPVEILAFVVGPSPALKRFAETQRQVTIRVVPSGTEIDQQLLDVDALLCLEAEIDAPLLMTKMVSYLRFGKPILGICAPGGTTAQLLAQTETGLAVAYDNPAEIASSFKTLARWKSEGTGFQSGATTLDRFTPETAVREFRALLGDLRSGNKGLQGEAWP